MGEEKVKLNETIEEKNRDKLKRKKKNKENQNASTNQTEHKDLSNHI